MSELMLVNPRHKRRHSPRKMSALQRQYFGGGASRKRRRRSVALASNPRRHRRHTALRANPRPSRRRRHVTRLRRNPMRFNARSFLNDTLLPAGVGAVGAMGVDLAMGYSAPYLPAMLQTGIGNTVARIAGAVGVGYLVGMAGGKRFGEQAMAGALVVTLYSLIKPMVASAVPGLPLSGYGMGWIAPGMQVDQGMGIYVGSDHAYGGGMSGAPFGMYVSEQEGDYIRTQ